jgi:hypothetical protein
MNPVHKIPPYFCEASSLNPTNSMDVYLALWGIKMRNLLLNAIVISSGLFLALKVPRISLIVRLLRAEFRWKWVWSNSRMILTGKCVSTRRKVCTCAFCRLQISHWMGWEITRICAMRGRRLTP